MRSEKPGLRSMRLAVVAILLTASATPALANGAIRQFPALIHKAGAACAGKHRCSQRGTGYRYLLGECPPGGK